MDLVKSEENSFAQSGLSDCRRWQVKVNSSQLDNKDTPAIQISAYRRILLSRTADLCRAQGRLVETLVGWFLAAFALTEMKTVLIFVAKRNITAKGGNPSCGMRPEAVRNRLRIRRFYTSVFGTVVVPNSIGFRHSVRGAGFGLCVNYFQKNFLNKATFPSWEALERLGLARFFLSRVAKLC